VKELVRRDRWAIDPVLGRLNRDVKYTSMAALAASGGSLVASIGLHIAGRDEVGNRLLAWVLPVAILFTVLAGYAHFRFRAAANARVRKMEAEILESQAEVQRVVDDGLARIASAEQAGKVTPEWAMQKRRELLDLAKDLPSLPQAEDA
jgi:hypothetical protein